MGKRRAVLNREAVPSAAPPYEDRPRVPKLSGLNPTQNQLINAVRHGDQAIVTGPAGTGKTYVLARLACEFYEEHRSNRLVMSRPNVPAGRSIGFFPGTLDEKMAPWVAEYMGIIKETLGTGKVECGLKNGRIEVVPFEVMRGRSFSNAFILLDEGQNATEEEAMMFWTRTGANSKVVMNGDLAQSDIGPHNGLRKSLLLAEHFDLPVARIQFTREDIVRSGICAQWAGAFEDGKSIGCST